MPASRSQPIPARLQSAPTAPTLTELLAQQPHITNLQQFLAEHDDSKAIRYWLEEYVPRRLIKTPRDIVNALNRAVADIDALINTQINAIMHHPRFQQLEASWRGLWMLVDQIENSKNIKIKILDISWAEVSKDISRAMEFDHSLLFQKVYSEEYGTPGGEPYGVILGDYAVSHRPSEDHPYDDILTLEGLSQIAAAAFSPFITSASSDIFGMEDFSPLGQPINIPNIFVQDEYIRWRALREKPDSRFIGITVPRILMRRPYLTRPGSYKGVYFHEFTAAATNNYLWGNACYAFGLILLREFASVGWFGHIRGVPRNYLSGGLSTALPVDSFDTDADGIAIKPVTDVIITDMVEKELSDSGFIPLCQCYNSNYAAFYNNQSVQLPKVYNTSESRANAKLSAMMQHVLCGSRFAHYIKVMFRDKVGSFISAAACEDFLRNWLFNYTTGREDMEWSDQARYPLREAAVQVKEHPMKPGQYICIIHLRPHYQLDHMVSELELITELAAMGK